MLKTLKKLLSLLDGKQKAAFPLILLMMFIETLFEAIGISLIVPLVSAIMDENIVDDNPVVAAFCSIFQINSQRTFIICCIASLIAVFVVKNIFMLIECLVRNNFIYKARHIVQRKIFSSVLNRPYGCFLNAQSGEIMREVTDDCDRTFSLFGSLMDVCANFILVICITVVLMLINPSMTIVAIVMMAVLSFVLIVLVRPTLKKQGGIFLKYATRYYKNILEAVQGIKTVKITKSRQYFYEEFRKNGEKVVEAGRKRVVINRIPYAVTECVCVSSVLIYVLIQYLNEVDITVLIPAIGAFAFASLKLIPSVRMIINAYYAIAYNEEAVDKVVGNVIRINDCDSEKPVEMLKLKNQIELRNVTYQYPNSDRKILDHASLTIPVGKSVGIMGLSGIGKTTSVDVLLGLLSPQEGCIAFDGREVDINIDNYPIQIGYVPQSLFILNDTIRSNVAFGVPEDEIRDDVVWDVIKTAQLDDFVNALPDGIHTDIGENGVRISGGQRQRIGIARALYRDPDLLIFDEATSSLDLKTEASVLDAIESLHGKKTILVIAHRPQTVEKCDHIYKMVDGKFVYDERKDIFKK